MDNDPVKDVFRQAEDVAPLESDQRPTPPDPDLSDPPDQPPQTPEDKDVRTPLERAADQPLNDYGNGQRLIVHFGEDLMFVPRVGWYLWDGQRWAKDVDELDVRAKAQQIAPLILEEIDYIQPTRRERKVIEDERKLKLRETELHAIPPGDVTGDQEKEIAEVSAKLKQIEAVLKDHKSLIGRRLTHGKNAGNNGPITHMISESKTSLATPYEALDIDPLEVNTQSGVLRFSKVDCRPEISEIVGSVDLVPHERDQKLTKMVSASFDTKAAAPGFEKFLNRILPDREVREFLQRWFGLSMSGLKYQGFVFLYGSGANGKSVLVDLIGKILGDYGASVRIESLTGSNRRQGSDATPDLIPLMGARIVRTSEPDQSQQLQEGLIKQLTGGEPIQIRPNFGEFIDIEPFFKLVMSGNHKPDIRGTDDGIWRRVMLVPFDVQIPEKERIEKDEFMAQLWKERDGILNWLIDGFIGFLENGLEPPKIITDATLEYRRESDPIGSFLQRCCTITGDATDFILSSELGHSFNFDLMERGFSTWKPTTFAKQISTISKQWKHPETGKMFEKGKASLSRYTGLKLTDAFRRRFDAAPRDGQGRPLYVPSDITPNPDVSEN